MGFSLKRSGMRWLAAHAFVASLMIGAGTAHADVFASAADTSRRLDNMERELNRLKASAAQAPRSADGASPDALGRRAGESGARPGRSGAKPSDLPEPPDGLPPPPPGAEDVVAAAEKPKVRVIGVFNGLLLVEDDSRPADVLEKLNNRAAPAKKDLPPIPAPKADLAKKAESAKPASHKAAAQAPVEPGTPQVAPEPRRPVSAPAQNGAPRAVAAPVTRAETGAGAPAAAPKGMSGSLENKEKGTK